MAPPLVTASQAILSSLASENRHVLSVWRALIYLRRSSFQLSSNQRRWHKLPESESDISQYIRLMEANGDLRSVRGATRIYRANTPFARNYSIDMREVLFEEHAYTILSHFSALDFHGLTIEQPKVITALSAARVARDVLPLGTDASDWEDIPLPSMTRPRSVLGQEVRWIRMDPIRLYGYSIYSPLGVPYRVTSPERTLVDALQRPEHCGGIGNVLRSWSRGRDMIDLSLVEQYTERYGIALLRQRVGYVLEELGFTSRMLDEWAMNSKRGGSSKLVGSEAFNPCYSDRWNVSLNGPVHILQQDSFA